MKSFIKKVSVNKMLQNFELIMSKILKSPEICKTSKNYFKICHENTINHFGGRNELLSIRLYRLTSFLFAFITCLCFTISFYVDWQNNPVMVAYDNEFTDTSEVST